MSNLKRAHDHLQNVISRSLARFWESFALVTTMKVISKLPLDECIGLDDDEVSSWLWPVIGPLARKLVVYIVGKSPALQREAQLAATFCRGLKEIDIIRVPPAFEDEMCSLVKSNAKALRILHLPFELSLHITDHCYQNVEQLELCAEYSPHLTSFIQDSMSVTFPHLKEITLTVSLFDSSWDKILNHRYEWSDTWAQAVRDVAESWVTRSKVELTLNDVL